MAGVLWDSRTQLYNKNIANLHTYFIKLLGKNKNPVHNKKLKCVIKYCQPRDRTSLQTFTFYVMKFHTCSSSRAQPELKAQMIPHHLVSIIRNYHVQNPSRQTNQSKQTVDTVQFICTNSNVLRICLQQAGVRQEAPFES